jgi:hypothetical protein
MRMPDATVPRRLALLALVLLAAALWWPARADASSCVTLELFLYNLTGNQITANWVDEAGNMVSLPVDGQSVVYIGQPCINVSGGKAFPLSIEDPADGFVNAEYTINAEDCLQENWLAALLDFPTDCAGISIDNSISYYIDSDRQSVCIQGPDGSPAHLSPNAALGVTSLKDTCPGSTPMFSVDFNDYNGDRFTWPIVLGTYAPTAGQGLSALPVLPGLSPSGVSPCVGSVCVVPDHDADYNFWPVTIYWYATAGGVPGFTFNGDTAFQLNGSYTGLNIPSHLSNFLSTDTTDVYVPPASTADADFPAPCWPTFDETGDLITCAPTSANVPAYVANPNAKSGLAQSILKITNDVVTSLVDIITIGGVF